jgi:hypothetical protein
VIPHAAGTCGVPLQQSNEHSLARRKRQTRAAGRIKMPAVLLYARQAYARGWLQSLGPRIGIAGIVIRKGARS